MTINFLFFIFRKNLLPLLTSLTKTPARLRIFPPLKTQHCTMDPKFRMALFGGTSLTTQAVAENQNSNAQAGAGTQSQQSAQTLKKNMQPGSIID